MAKTRKRKGGKIIGEGAFAVIIDPAIPCKDGRDMSKYVSRVSKRANDADLVSKDHPKLIEKLRKIDPDQKYFFYPDHCVTGKLTQQNLADGITYKMKSHSEFLLRGTGVWNDMVAENTTRTWSDFFRGKAVGKAKGWDAQSQEKIDHLEKAFELLHENRITHNDVHGYNVVIAEDDLPRIIDFSFAVVNSSNSRIENEKEHLEFIWPSLDARLDPRFPSREDPRFKRGGRKTRRHKVK